MIYSIILIVVIVTAIALNAAPHIAHAKKKAAEAAKLAAAVESYERELAEWKKLPEGDPFKRDFNRPRDPREWSLYSYRYESGVSQSAAAFGFTFASIVLLLLGCGGSAWMYADSLSAKNVTRQIEVKTQQRDELIAGIRADMSSDEFVRLQTATSSDDITIIFGSGVSDFLIARAQTIVDLNQDLFDMINMRERKLAGVCNGVGNPFVPRIPFATPDCEL